MVVNVNNSNNNNGSWWPLTLTYLFKRTRHVSPVFVWDLLRLVGGFLCFASAFHSAVSTFENGGCFAALAAFGGG